MSMAPGWPQAARAALVRGATALVSVIGSEGSVPRGPGTRMVVTAAEAVGTIGGGRLEFEAIEQARAMLAQPPGSWRVQDWPLGPLLGQCCGGRVRLLIERLDPQAAGWLEECEQPVTLVTTFVDDRLLRDRGDPRQPPSPPAARGERPGPGDRLVERIGQPPRPVLLFGAGHVGRAVARACAGLPLALAWFDTRAAWADAPGATLVAEEEALACARAAPPEGAVAILTHDHELDYRLTVAALASAAGFVGLIGSATKRARFLSRMARDGVDPGRLTCPIGLPQVPGKVPEAIAIAIVAQLLALGPPA